MFLLCIFALFIAGASSAMSDPSTPAAVISGFGQKVSGTTMGYESPLPWMREALICRAGDGTSSIAWRSEPVTFPAGAGRVRLVWLAGLGCNLGDYGFTLALGERALIEFTTRDEEEWQIRGAGGEILGFRTINRDRHKDRFGLMTLDLPAAGLREGEPLDLRITGSAARSSGWVMTFTGPLRQEFFIVPAGVVTREKGQPVAVEIVYLGEKGEALLRAEGQPAARFPLRFGRNSFPLFYTPVDEEKSRSVTVEIDGRSFTKQFVHRPVRPWTLFLVQHSHTDIGYTRPQAEILAEHLRYIDYALDFCDQTDDLPDDARFRWTCETSWAVREYLKSRPAAQIERLIRRVREGRIEVTAQLLNWSELPDENALLHSLEPLRQFQEMGLPVCTAMQNDVNGFAWCLVDYFSALGIRYVTSGINDHRALKPFTVPTAFRWESPAGKRVLAFRADHYMTGNMLGMLSGSEETFVDSLTIYLRGLEEKGYPHDALSLQFSGYFTDNSPPSTLASEVIASWNAKYLWPRLRSATAREFLDHLAASGGESLPVLRAAWPDWWTDGFGSAQRETAAGREAQAGMIANQGLFAIARLAGIELPPSVPGRIAAVMDPLNFWHEHTMGAAESISDPLAANSREQWAEKASWVWSGAMQSRLLRESALGFLQSIAAPARVPSLVVYNTLNWERSGLHTVYIDNQILPKEKAFRLLDEEGLEVAAQLAGSRPEGNYWAVWIDRVPPLGWRTLRIEIDERPRTALPPFAPAAGIVENRYYHAEMDEAAGGLRSLIDKELGSELLDPQRRHQLGEVIYERLHDRRAMEALTLGEFTRTPLQQIHLEPGIDGPIWQSFYVSGSGTGFTRLRCELRFFKEVKRIELHFSGRKISENEPEGLYVAFPFALPGGRLFFEAQGGVVSPGIDQIEGTANDWNTVQNYAALRAKEGQIVLASSESPLMQFGGINTGRYRRGALPESGQIYSWVLNNYWTTNFCASQEGEIAWSYALTSGQDGSSSAAARFGWGLRVPLVSRVLPASSAGRSDIKPCSQWPFAAEGSGELLLVSARPCGEGVLFHLREAGGQPAALALAPSHRSWQLDLCDPLGRPLGRQESVRFAPFEVRFVRITHQRG